ncbi:hypothetical protein SAMN05421870_10211 [Streptomyces qinglanensis]|uniref:Uncharacterized protein n=1 Tax=Streptomyces qinglanensis TaxID=943816 RepID=A0A1H9PHB8_9ACTN|nr:hypothetical protein SAMN05421870_10211 [Streptomyces qinglanensis]
MPAASIWSTDIIRTSPRQRLGGRRSPPTKQTPSAVLRRLLSRPRRATSRPRRPRRPPAHRPPQPGDPRTRPDREGPESGPLPAHPEPGSRGPGALPSCLRHGPPVRSARLPPEVQRESQGRLLPRPAADHGRGRRGVEPDPPPTQSRDLRHRRRTRGRRRGSQRLRDHGRRAAPSAVPTPSPGRGGGEPSVRPVGLQEAQAAAPPAHRARPHLRGVLQRTAEACAVRAEAAGERTYDWQRVTPQHRLEPSDDLELHISSSSNYSRKKDWGDTSKKPAESQISSVSRTLKSRAEEEERARKEREAEQRRLREERERKEEERRRREAEERKRTQQDWETAVGKAKVNAVQAAQAERFGTACEQWRTAGEMRTFYSAHGRSRPHHGCGRKRSPASVGRVGAGGSRPTRPHRERPGAERTPLSNGANGRRTAAVPRRLASGTSREGEAERRGRSVQTGAIAMARIHRRTSGSRLKIRTPRSHSMVEAMTPCPRRRSSSSARSTSFPRRVTSSRRATISS